MRILFLAALGVGIVLVLGCSSDDRPARDTASGGTGGGSAGSGGGSSGSAGAGGTAGDSDGGVGGAAGLVAPDAGLHHDLPQGCVPDDMQFACNPVTNEGCDDSAGEACEYGMEEYFTCFPAPNDVDEGGACDWETGPYCAPTLTCDPTTPGETAGVCRRHCCSDGDCESGQSCEAYDPDFGTLGACR